MKEIANKIEAQVSFRHNELNEKRMAPELLDSVHSRISRKGTGLKEKADILKIKGMPLFIGNVESHEDEHKVSLDD